MTLERHSAAHEQNRQVWDRMVRDKQRFTRPARDEDFADPLKTVDAAGWLGGDIRQKRLLCLAAGGGRQSALYAAAGADVTVVDISAGMLELDREVARERGLSVRTVEASMDDLSMFGDASFDIVIQPVSTCYVPNVRLVYEHVARIISEGGVYISQHKTPTNLQAAQQASITGYELVEPYYRTGPLPQVEGSRLRESGTLEFLHRWEELVGGMCRAGFLIEDLVEPMHSEPHEPPGRFGHRCHFIAPYVRIKARRQGQAPRPAGTRRTIWTPT